MEWRVVRGRARGGGDRREGKRDFHCENIGGSTFFFRNFPENCSREELWWYFDKIGKVSDVFLPAKRDVKGKRFGFVRFSDSLDDERRLTKLNNIWIDSYLLRAYVPKYEKRKGEGRDKEPRKERKEKTTAKHQDFGESSLRKEGISYSEALHGRVSDLGNRVKGQVITKETTIQFQSTEKEGEWLQGAFTGRLKEVFNWKDHGDEIQSECVGQLELTNMDGNLILIKSVSGKPTEETLKGLDEWANFWLQWCRAWSYIDVNQNRRVWTRWRGVPLQAWSSRFFGIASARIGDMMNLHEDTSSKKRLDEALVLISTGWDSIDRLLEVKIDGACFKIRIEEISDQEMKELLKSSEEVDSSSDEESDGDGERNSVQAVLEEGLELDDDDDVAGKSQMVASNVVKGMEASPRKESLESEKTAGDCFNVDSQHVSDSLEVDNHECDGGSLEINHSLSAGSNGLFSNSYIGPTESNLDLVDSARINIERPTDIGECSKLGPNQKRGSSPEDLRQAHQIPISGQPKFPEDEIILRDRNIWSATRMEATIPSQRDESWRNKKKEKCKKKRGMASCPVNCKNSWSDFISDMREGDDGGVLEN